MKRCLGIIVIGLLLNGNVYAEKNFDGFLNSLTKSRNLKITIDFENTAKQFGYKNFEEFVDEYKTKYDLEDITTVEAKEFLTGVDKTVEIIESEENLKILHKLILKDKFVKKYLRKKKKHAKILAIYFDYEKEMAKISKNPNLNKIGRFVSFWQWHTNPGASTYSGQKNDALIGCDKERKKRGVPDGGKCMLIEYRYGDEFEILIKKQLTKSSDQKKSSSSNIVKQFNQLDNLYKSGALTEEEFNQAKQKLLLEAQ